MASMGDPPKPAVSAIINRAFEWGGAIPGPGLGAIAFLGVILTVFVMAYVFFVMPLLFIGLWLKQTLLAP
jgi:hypothetical protein